MIGSARLYQLLFGLSCLFIWLPSGYCQSPGELINAYEYWVDDDFNSRTLLEVVPTASLEINENLDIGVLQDGIHKISFRFRDNAGIWSGIMKKTFVHFKAPVQNNAIVKAEYWFDSDYSTLTELPIIANEIVELNASVDCSALSPGFHTICFRFLDLDGNYHPGALQSFFIQPSYTGNELVIAYRYWFNDNQEDALTVFIPPVDPLELEADLETTGIGAGPNQRLNIQFQNSALLWTGVYCGYFERLIGCLADINGDTDINSADLLAILSVFGCTGDCGAADINADGIVNSGDLSFILTLYGTNCLIQE